MVSWGVPECGSADSYPQVVPSVDSDGNLPAMPSQLLGLAVCSVGVPSSWGEGGTPAQSRRYGLFLLEERPNMGCCAARTVIRKGGTVTNDAGYACCSNDDVEPYRVDVRSLTDLVRVVGRELRQAVSWRRVRRR